MRSEPARSILHSVGTAGDEGGDLFFARAYNMNLYRGCSHGCIYCDARSLCYRLAEPGVVRVKENALAILRDELRRKRAPGIVGMGGMSDAYNPQEGRTRLTRGALALLAQYGFGIGITTKSPLVTRDIDLLQAIQRNAPAHVTFSITTIDDRLSKRIEPGVARSSVRLAALRKLTQAGIPAGVWINPVLPFITDDPDDFRALLAAIAENGGQYALTYYGMTLREGDREYFYAALDRDFPGLKRRYAEAYGLQYEIASPNAATLHELFQSECARLGLATTFEAANRIILQSGGYRQQSLF